MRERERATKELTLVVSGFGREQWREVHLGRLLKEQEKGAGGGVEAMEVDEDDLYS